jgi:hypothetical protein
MNLIEPIALQLFSFKKNLQREKLMERVGHFNNDSIAVKFKLHQFIHDERKKAIEFNEYIT